MFFRCNFNGVLSDNVVSLSPRLVQMRVALNVSDFSGIIMSFSDSSAVRVLEDKLLARFVV